MSAPTRAAPAAGREGGLYAEKWVPFAKELACMVVRTAGEGVTSYPVVETVQRDNICHTVVVPAQVPGAAYANAVKVCADAIAALPANSRGVYGVEVFLLDDGRDTVLFNEVVRRRRPRRARAERRSRNDPAGRVGRR